MGKWGLPCSASDSLHNGLPGKIDASAAGSTSSKATCTKISGQLLQSIPDFVGRHQEDGKSI